MRIAISADTNNDLDSRVGAHFGRCPYFALVDVEGTEVKGVKVVENPFYAKHSPGQVPSFINNQGASVMLAGGMGRRAVTIFEQMGIRAATGATGTVRQALQSYLGGELRGVKPCAESEAHHAAGHQHEH
jgi:predicted Fe-Mo cluster-binding NifX family protein